MGFGWLAIFFGVVLTVGIVVLIIYAVLSNTNRSGRFDATAFPNSHETPRESYSRALEILAERYAKGEINDEEYKQKKNELKQP